MAERDMDGGNRGRSPGGPHWTLGLSIVVALSVLAWLALPVEAADRETGPWGQGPVLSNVTLNPSPLVPRPGPVYLNASARDASSVVAAGEFFFDQPGLDGTSTYRLKPADGMWDSLLEDVTWIGTYGAFTQTLRPGPHVAYVHARNAAGAWGSYTSLGVFVGTAQTIGPSTYAPNASPVNVSVGAPLTIRATVVDHFGAIIRGAEFFRDTPGPDGAGTPMDATDGVFNTPAESVLWTGPVPVPFGNHMVWIHGYNGDVWGPPMAATFTSMAPAFSLELAADREAAAPGDLVTYRVSFENRGNANAKAWLNLTLPPDQSYVSDTVAGAGGGRTIGTRYVFDDVAQLPYGFTVSARLAANATDGLSLTAGGTLEFTNDQGWRFPTVPATATLTVVAPEIALAVLPPTVVYAGETATLTIRIVHSGVQTVHGLVVVLTGSPAPHVVSDTAAAIAGTAIGPSAWRFPSLGRGEHDFQVTELVSPMAMDQSMVDRSAEATYVSRLGAATTARSTATMSVARPVFTAAIDVDRSAVEVGGRVAFALHFVNQGSAPARTVRLTVALAPGLSRIGGDAPTTARGAELAWDFVSVAPGGYTVSLVAVGRLVGRSDLTLELTYASPNGVALARAGAVNTVVVTEAPFPIAAAYASAGLLGAVAGLGGFVATERGKTAFFFLLIPLYTRLQKEHVLDHETRGMIRGYILANPGDHYNSIKQALELPNGTLAYHLQVLEKEYLVKSVKDGKFRRFYPSEMRMPEGGEPTKIQRVILDLIRANPGMTPRDAAALLGLTSSTVSYHLERLQELARIEYRREGISKRLYLKTDPPA